HDSSCSTQAAERLLVQFGPDARAGAKYQQPNRLATVAERHHEQPRASVLATLWVSHHGARAVIDLGFFARRGLDHHAGFRLRPAAKFVDETLDALIAGSEALAIHQVLPDPHRIPAARKSQFDRFAVRLARTRRWAATGPWPCGECWSTSGLRAKVGGH